MTQIPEAVINNQDGLTASLKLLQEHGITMLPNDDNNILSTVMESGHSVVLTGALFNKKKHYYIL